MDFSVKRIGEENMHFFESEKESSVQLVFLPGGLNPEIWRNQYRYFSREFKTVCFQPTKSFRDYEGEKSALKNVLDLDSLDNVVLVSCLFGNSLALEFEDHDSVEALVMTSAFKGVDSMPPRLVYNRGWNMFAKHPKLLKKYFFSEQTDFKVAKEFAEMIDKPDYRDIESFVDSYRFNRPVKKSLVVHADDDRFSSLDFARELDRPMISRLNSAGSFSFFEKPEEFNKVLHDFLRGLKRDKKQEKIQKAQQLNSSLKDFTHRKKDRRKVEKKVKTV
jgi:pimeloyl-ACP methyl ester carboxylesterase